MNISIGEFAKQHDIPKSTVYTKCKALGLDTSEGIKPDDVETLKAEFNIKNSMFADVEVIDPGSALAFKPVELPAILNSDLTVTNIEVYKDPIALVKALGDAKRQALQFAKRQNEEILKKADETREALRLLEEQEEAEKLEALRIQIERESYTRELLRSNSQLNAVVESLSGGK